MGGWKNEINTRRTIGKRKLEKQTESKSEARKRIKKELDSVSREIMRIRYGYTCVTCKKTKDSGAIICWAHLLDQRVEATRWDDDNLALQCAPCNNLHRYKWGYYLSWHLTKYGVNVYNDLWKRHTSGKRYTLVELDLLLNQKKNELARLLMRMEPPRIDDEIVF